MVGFVTRTMQRYVSLSKEAGTKGTGGFFAIEKSSSIPKYLPGTALDQVKSFKQQFDATAFRNSLYEDLANEFYMHTKNWDDARSLAHTAMLHSDVNPPAIDKKGNIAKQKKKWWGSSDKSGTIDRVTGAELRKVLAQAESMISGLKTLTDPKAATHAKHPVQNNDANALDDDDNDVIIPIDDPFMRGVKALQPDFNPPAIHPNNNNNNAPPPQQLMNLDMEIANTHAIPSQPAQPQQPNPVPNPAHHQALANGGQPPGNPGHRRQNAVDFNAPAIQQSAVEEVGTSADAEDD